MDSHGHHRRSGSIRRDAHLRIHEKRQVTEVETVFVTASSDGDGEIIGFTTLSDPPTTTAQVKTTGRPNTRTSGSAKSETSPTQSPSPTTALPKSKSTTVPTTRSDPPKSSSTPAPAPSSQRSSSTPSSIIPSTTSSTTSSPSSSSSSSSQIASSQETSSQTTFSTQISSILTSSTTSTTPTVNDPTSPSGVLVSQTADPTLTSEGSASGISTVATVGMIAGACAVLLVLGAFAAFFYRRKAQKKMAAAYGKTEDEKFGASGGSGGGIVYNEKVNGTPTAMYSEKAPRISVRPVTEFMPNLNTPPAAGAAAAAATYGSGLSAAPSETRRAPPPALSLVTNEPIASSPFNSNSEIPGLASPTNSNFNDIGAAGAGAVAGAAALMNPVHRVQMDFKPSMGDELELRSGALVRLLHEYDDGWALCTRLDRSQQGVCPRTCLSQRPVKPRPQGAPDSPLSIHTANGLPQSPIIRPYSPAQSPITGPQNRNFAQPQRPQSPAMPRSPGVGYVKAQYRPASAQSPVQSRPGTPTRAVPQSPIVGSGSPPPSLRVGPPLITISTASELGPASPSSSSSPQSPASTPSPAFTPIKPSPLSNQQTASIPTGEALERKDEVKTEGEPLVFHAM